MESIRDVELMLTSGNGACHRRMQSLEQCEAVNHEQVSSQNRVEDTTQNTGPQLHICSNSFQNNVDML